MKRELLLKQLETVSPALAAIDLIPIMTHFWFTGKRIGAFNDTVAIDVLTAVKLNCAVPGSLMLDLLRKTFSKEIELELEKERLYVHAGKSRIKLPVLPAETFLEIWPKYEKHGTIIDVMPNRLARGLELCLLATSTDTSLPEQTGVTFEVDGKHLCLYATNKEVVVRAQLKWLGETPELKRATLPRVYCDYVRQMIVDHENVTLSIGKAHALCTSKAGDEDGKEQDAVRAFGRLVNVTDPLNFKKIFADHAPTDLLDEAIEIPDELRAAIERAVIISDPVEKTGTVIEIVDGTMTLSTKSDLGSIVDSVTLKSKHPDAKLRVNARLVKPNIEQYQYMNVTDKSLVLSNKSTVCLVAAYN